jgi:hypothetical protein
MLRRVVEAFVVIGASVLQRTLIEDVRARGFRVCALDGDAGAACLALADVPVVHDFSDLDGLARAVERAGVRPVAVASMGSDFAVTAVARLADELGLPGLSPATAFRATNKEEMIARFGVVGASAPARVAASLDEARDAYAAVGPDAIVKPSDSAGQRGTTRIGDAAALAAAFMRAIGFSRSGRVVVQSYVDGPEFTVSGFVVDGAYVPLNVTERVLHPPPPVGVCIAHRYPSGLDASLEVEMHDVVGRAAQALELDDVPTYAQVRLGKAGCCVLEVGARLGGGKDAELTRLVHGIDGVAAVIDTALGELSREALEPREAPVDACAVTAFPVVAPGRVRRAAEGTVRAVPGVVDVGFFWRAGQTLPPLASSGGRLGYVQLTAPTLDELERRRLDAFAALDVEVEPVS